MRRIYFHYWQFSDFQAVVIHFCFILFVILIFYISLIQYYTAESPYSLKDESLLLTFDRIIKSFELQDYLFEEMILLDVVNKFFFHFLKGSSLEMLWKK